MSNRRSFIKKLGITFPAISFLGISSFAEEIPLKNGRKKAENKVENPVVKPVVLSTWDFGFAANQKAWETLESGGRAIDAVERGVQVPESDPNVMSVGYGGMPDRDGFVTLDSAIMDETGNCGSVAFIQGIKNPIKVARLVMDKTPHVMLVGKGAQDFAVSEGFKTEDLLTKKSKEAWEKWKTKANYSSKINVDNHDTIGMIALDKNGDLSGACTTSGLAWKLHGRVGDSPIIGAALFVDNEIGAATATGKGEAVIKTVGAHLIVELMRQGNSPQKACELAVKRIIDKNADAKNFQVGYLALNKKGETGAYSIQKGFTYNEFNPDKKEKMTAEYHFKTEIRTY